MFDFEMTSRAIAKYEATINKFIGESLNINYKKPTLFDKLKLKLSSVSIQRQKTDNPLKEIVRVYRGKKLVSEREFEFDIISCSKFL